MTDPELQHLLRDFYLERVALLMRHEETAKWVADYDANNAYQYAISREETHLSWLQHALLDLGAGIPPDPPRPTVPAPGRGKDAWKSLAAEDARLNHEFIERWRPAVERVAHARHKGMLKVILGEMIEQQRFFEQAAAGRRDLLGTHLPINERRGQVLPARWIE